MNSDPMRLVRFVCVATAHANGRSDATLTIHERSWAFCPAGGNRRGHDWQPSDGLPLAEARRLTSREVPPVRPSPELAPPEDTPAARPR